MSRWRSVLKTVAEKALVSMPRATTSGDRLILAYHNVVPTGSEGLGDRSLHLPVKKFEEQLEILRREVDVVPLMDLLSESEADTPRVAITFDDAYASALQLGVRACVSRRLPCTVFVAPGLLGRVPEWDLRAEEGAWSEADRTQFLDGEQGIAKRSRVGQPPEMTARLLSIACEGPLLEFAGNPLVRFGNHTFEHPNLASLPSERIAQELSAARQWLEPRCAAALVPVVAYPYGLEPADAASHLDNCGASFGLAVSGGWLRHGQRFDPALVPRWNVPASISADGFRVRIRGRLAA